MSAAVLSQSSRTSVRGLRVPRQRWSAGPVARGLCVPPQAKMYVPTDGFGGMSPEHVVSNVVKKVCIHASVKVVTKLEEVQKIEPPQGGDPTMTDTLSIFLAEKPVGNTDDWLRDIMQRNERPLDMATTKLLSVREQFAEENFNWTLMEQLALSQLQEESSKLMSEYMMSSMTLGEITDEDMEDSPRDDEAQ